MKYQVSETFKSLSQLVVELPEKFFSTGEVVYAHRNIIKRIKSTEGDLIVKNFKGMYFFNRVAFSLLAKSKAERSYLHAELLKKNGFVTPPNVAWLDRYFLGLLMESYYVSVYSPWETFQDKLKVISVEESYKRSELIRQLAAFAFKLHQANIYHNDFSVRNILIIPQDKECGFALVDLNRMYFGYLDYIKRLRNFIRLDLPEQEINLLIEEYAKLSGKPAQESIEYFWKYKRNFSAFRRTRRKIRKYTLKPIENFVSWIKA